MLLLRPYAHTGNHHLWSHLCDICLDGGGCQISPVMLSATIESRLLVSLDYATRLQRHPIDSLPFQVCQGVAAWRHGSHSHAQCCQMLAFPSPLPSSFILVCSLSPSPVFLLVFAPQVP